MKIKYKYSFIDLENIIKKFKEIRDDDTLIKLIIILKNVEVILPVEIENVVSFTEISCIKDFENKMSICPLIVETTDGNTWSACFSSEDQITKDVKERFILIKMDFFDIAKDCLLRNNIDGVTINPFNDLHVHIQKDILKIIVNK